jgi:uncharacterized DUF497 family protein
MEPRGFEWDEAKRRSNLAKHRIDFLDATPLFDAPYHLNPARSVGDEQRWQATGWLIDRCVTVIFTERNGLFRLISARSARHAERQQYQAIFSH